MRALPGLLVCALAVAGCGLGPGSERKGGVEVRVTRDFGHRLLGSAKAGKLREGQTVMRFLRSRFRVGTRFGGGFVQSIDGLSGGGAGGHIDWFYFVNGVEATVGAGDYELSPGDVVQWDYRRWDAAMRVPAIVGAFPEPFRHGLRGKRFPVRVECADAGSEPCGEVKARLRRAGVATSGASLGAQGTRKVIRVIVGSWRRLRLVRAAAALEGPPKESGVFARFAARGRTLELLDAEGHEARRAASGTGLVAALAPSEDQVVWVITGVDDAGVERAASSLDSHTLRDAFAVAATPGGDKPLPVEGR
jgi:Domain of unknown function (DUF4430)